MGCGPPPPLPLENDKNIWFLSNTGLDPLKNNKSFKRAFNVLCWAIIGQLLMVFGSSLPQEKAELIPSDKTSRIRAWIRVCTPHCKDKIFKHTERTKCITNSVRTNNKTVNSSGQLDIHARIQSGAGGPVPRQNH